MLTPDGRALPPAGKIPKRGAIQRSPGRFLRWKIFRQDSRHGIILTVICNILFASTGRIRKVGFCNCQVRLLRPPKPNDQPMKCRNGAYPKIETILMKRTLLFLAAFTSFTMALQASPTPAPHSKRASTKSENKIVWQKTAANEIALSANGWSYVKGEWVHPDGYRYVNGKVLRTTARLGKAFPKPPGKLALENAQELTPKTTPAQDTKTAAETAAEARRRNLTPTAAPQTGTHL